MHNVTMFVSLGAGVTALLCLGLLAVSLYDHTHYASVGPRRIWFTVFYWCYIVAATICGYSIVCAVDAIISGV